MDVCDDIYRNGTDINDIECDICPSNTYAYTKENKYKRRKQLKKII